MMAFRRNGIYAGRRAAERTGSRGRDPASVAAILEHQYLHANACRANVEWDVDGLVFAVCQRDLKLEPDEDERR